MGKRLIICEKPSLARNVLSALQTRESFTKYDGYYESSSFVISYAFGHLFELYEPSDYQFGVNSKEKDKWTMSALPIIPKQFEYKLKNAPKKRSPDAGVKAQFQTLNRLCHRSDVDSVLHCGDADREGELIVRNILNQAKNTKPVYRLWLPEQTKNTILQAVDQAKPDTQYDNLADEGYARTYIDWLYGMNLTRYISLASGRFPGFPAGRVLCAIVEAIDTRDTEIENFQVSDYYQSQHQGTKSGVEYTLTTSKKEPDKEKAEAHTKELNTSGDLVVQSVESKQTVAKPPKLYSLSKVQGVLSKRYKMPMKKSLQIIQSLYEKGYLSYPRTNTEYLAEDEKDKVKDILATLTKHGYSVKFRDGKTIFDDSKIESHSALTPTYKFPTGLTGDEQKVYDTILNRFCAVFCKEDCILDKTKVVIRAGNGELFTLNGSVVRQQGFLKYEPSNKNKEIPAFEQGETLPPKFQTITKQTTPPAHYTVETLMNYLKNPYKQELAEGPAEDEDMSEEDYKAMFAGIEIGTEATRTGIIENAKNDEYIVEKKGSFYIQPRGRDLIRYMKDLGVNLSKTKSVELGKLLKSVNHGEITVQDAVDVVEKELRSEIDPQKGAKLQMAEGKEIGICPICGGRVYDFGGKTYTCENRNYDRKTKQVSGCPFTVWKSGKYYPDLPEEEMKSLLETGVTKTKIIHGTSKRGPWEAYLALNTSYGDGKTITKGVEGQNNQYTTAFKFDD